MVSHGYAFMGAAHISCMGLTIISISNSYYHISCTGITIISRWLSYLLSSLVYYHIPCPGFTIISPTCISVMIIIRKVILIILLILILVIIRIMIIMIIIMIITTIDNYCSAAWSAFHLKPESAFVLSSEIMKCRLLKWW